MPRTIHLEPYCLTIWDQACVNCRDPHCRMKVYGGRYFIVQFETTSLSINWWLSKN
jgi:hypothetical protein